MLDIKYIKENPEEVIARLAKKGKDGKNDIEMILSLDAERRAIIGEVEQLKAKQNQTNKLIPQYKKEGKDVSAIFVEMKELGAKIKADDDTKRLKHNSPPLCLDSPIFPMKIFFPVEKRTMSLCATMESPENSISNSKTTSTCAPTWVLSTTNAAQSFPATVFGSIPALVRASSGHCLTTLLIIILEIITS